jgi:hypothetical protein
LAAKIYNRAGVAVATTGTGVVTLGTALAAGTAINSCAFLNFAGAGAANGDIIPYLILDANGAAEWGWGVYTSAGTTLTRNLTGSTTGALLNLSGNAQLFIITRAQETYDPIQTLTDGATINWDMINTRMATVTLGGNRTLAAPTNMIAGSAILIVRQDATGTRTLAWNAAYLWPGGVDPVLSTAANSIDVFSFITDGTSLYGTYGMAFA